MTIGIGTDIIEIHRIEEMIEKWGESFLDKVFTENERIYSELKSNKYQHYAARFACKEAFFKAASHIPGFQFNWKSVEVSNSPSGKPEIIPDVSHNAVFEGLKFHLSLSHSNTHAIAFVLIEN